jgi:uncharacterized membrane protein
MRRLVIKLVRAMFVQLPVSLLAGGVLLGLLGVGLSRGELRMDALWLLRAGLPLGVLAAISRIMDAVLTVPKSRREDAMTTRHVNLGAAGLLLFCVALISRGSFGGAISGYTLAAETVGTLVLAAAALRSGHGRPPADVLVFRPVR